MRQIMFAGAMALTVLSAGCATKKYVAKTVAPVETHVANVEAKNDAKNADQDKLIATQGGQIQDLDKSLSQTKEKLTDTDAKAVAAGQSAAQANTAAAQANTAAAQANQAAGRAQQSADGARTFADQGLTRLERTIDAVNKFQMVKSTTVLFAVSESKLTAETKKELDEFAQQTNGLQRYIVEVQGFTDKTGSVATNEALSQARAEEVARYLANEHMIPLRSISMLGSGYAQPVADDKTRDGRKQNRRVEVRLFVPEAGSASVAQAQQ